jgi:hypothetical protein
MKEIENKHRMHYSCIKNKFHDKLFDITSKGKRNKSFEKELLKNKDAKDILYYIQKLIKDVWVEAEKIILEDEKYCFEYATYYMKRRWIEAENLYFDKIEISYDNKFSYYTPEVGYGGWKEWTHPVWFYIFKNIKSNKEWPEAERIILSNPEITYKYIKMVKKKEWPEAEKTILKDAKYSYYYAKNIIKGRWKKFEDYILFIRKPDEKYGQLIRIGNNDTYLAKYAALYIKDVIKENWKELEDLIIKNHNEHCFCSILFHYLKYFENKQLEEILKKYSDFTKLLIRSRERKTINE